MIPAPVATVDDQRGGAEDRFERDCRWRRPRRRSTSAQTAAAEEARLRHEGCVHRRPCPKIRIPAAVLVDGRLAYHRSPNPREKSAAKRRVVAERHAVEQQKPVDAGHQRARLSLRIPVARSRNTVSSDPADRRRRHRSTRPSTLPRAADRAMKATRNSARSCPTRRVRARASAASRAPSRGGIEDDTLGPPESHDDVLPGSQSGRDATEGDEIRQVAGKPRWPRPRKGPGMSARSDDGRLAAVCRAAYDEARQRRRRRRRQRRRCSRSARRCP